jgi:hypothetical protein
MANKKYYLLDDSGIVGEVRERTQEEILRDTKVTLAYISKKRGSAQHAGAKRGVSSSKGRVRVVASGAKRAVAKRIAK